ncbi:MAG TPA: hypothetical protein VFT59_03975, partial [Candidatus Saccharimonadales bacterium]|nr:hypothetical protein [Candidatus Saccharimonadales bacterium]
MKLTLRDITTLLQQFHQSDERPDSHAIDQLKISHPKQQTTVASFRFRRDVYYIIIDVTAEDDTIYLMDIIHADKP